MDALIAGGPLVADAVRVATTSSDAEVRYRAEGILKEIDRKLFATRREAFLSVDTSQLKQNIQSWQRLSQITGNSLEARELFLRMQVEAQPLLDAAESDPQNCSALINRIYKCHAPGDRI